MPITLAMLAVHGMGVTKQGYSSELTEPLKRLIPTVSYANLAFEEVYYQSLLQNNQALVFAAMRPHIDWMRLREFLLYGFSDAASLETNKDRPNSAYTRTQEMIRSKLDSLFALSGNRAIPIVIAAHSLGCQVISNYIWDAQQQVASDGIWSQPQDPAIPAGSARDNFLRLKTVERFYTTGCNIPIFVAGHATIEPIVAPNANFQWINFFDQDDVLGWPLGPLSDSYGALVEDVSVNSGGGAIGTLLKSWNPASHTQYWKDSEVYSRIASELREYL